MNKCLLVFSFLLIFACSKDSPPVVDIDGPILSGFYQRDIMGVVMGSEGYPNVKLLNGDDYFISTFPNPSDNGLFTLHIKAPENTIKEVTLVKAIMDPTAIEDTASVTIEGDPVFQRTTNETGIMNMIFSAVKSYDTIVTSSDIREAVGYYRVYVKIDDVLLWDNLLVSE